MPQRFQSLNVEKLKSWKVEKFNFQLFNISTFPLIYKSGLQAWHVKRESWNVRIWNVEKISFSTVQHFNISTLVEMLKVEEGWNVEMLKLSGVENRATGRPMPNILSTSLQNAGKIPKASTLKAWKVDMLKSSTFNFSFQLSL